MAEEIKGLLKDVKDIEKIESKEIKLLEKIEIQNKNQFKNIEEFLKHIQKHAASKAITLSTEIRKNTISAIVAGFAVIIALVWKDTIQLGIDELIAEYGEK